MNVYTYLHNFNYYAFAVRLRLHRFEDERINLRLIDDDVVLASVQLFDLFVYLGQFLAIHFEVLHAFQRIIVHYRVKI